MCRECSQNKPGSKLRVANGLEEGQGKPMCHGDVVQERSKLKSHLNSSPSATVKLAWTSYMFVFPLLKTAKRARTFEKLSESPGCS